MDLHTIIPTIDPTSSVALAIPHHGKSVAITTTLVHKRHKEQVDVVALDGTGPTTALSHTLWPTITRWHALFEACKQVAPILGAGHTSVPITPHVLYVTQGPLGNRHNIAWWNAPITSPFGLLDAWSALRAGDTAWLAKGVGSIVPGKDVTTARALVSSPYASLHPIIV